MNKLKWMVVIETDTHRREMIMEGQSEIDVLNAATKIAERMGGSFLDVVSCCLSP